MKAKHLKRMLSVAVASAMVLTSTPVGIMAEDSGTEAAPTETPEATPTEAAAPTEEAAPSGAASPTEAAPSEAAAPTEEAAPSEAAAPTEAAPSEAAAPTEAPATSETPEPSEDPTPSGEPEASPSTSPEATPTEEAVEPITLTWSAPAKITYDGKDHTAEYKAADVEGLTLSYSITKDGEAVQAIKDAGAYEITANVTANETKAEIQNTTYKLTVEKAVVSEITWSGTEGLTTAYNTSTKAFDTLAVPKATFQDGTGTHSLQVALTYVGDSVSAPQYAGSYGATASLTNDLAKNFVLDKAIDNLEIDFEVEKQKVAVTWLVDGEEADLAALTYNGKAQTITASNNLGIELSLTGTTEVTDCSDADGEVSASFADSSLNDNMELTEETITQKLHMDPYEVTPTWEHLEADYTGKELQLDKIAEASFETVGDETEKVSLTIQAAAGTDAGEYELELEGMPEAYSGNYEFAEDTTTATFVIKGIEVEVQWSGESREYTGTNYNDPRNPEWSASAETPEGVVVPLDFTINEKSAGNVDMTEPGMYVIVASTENKSVTLTEETKTIEISKAEVELSWETETIYNGEEQLPEASFEGVDGETHYAVVTVDGGSAVNAGSYAVSASLEGEDAKHYKISEDSLSGQYTIQQLAVTVKPVDGQSKLYGEEDPTPFQYSVEENDYMEAEDIEAELGENVLDREYAEEDSYDFYEPVGEYAYILANGDDFDNETYANYEVTLDTEGVYFEIQKLPVVIVPDNGQEKIYGEKDPSVYTYSVEHTTDSTIPVDGDLSVKAELGDLDKDILYRESGELPGTYEYLLNAENYDGNYDLSIQEDVVFTINSPSIEETTSLNSRSSSFSVSTDIARGEGAERDSSVKTDIVITANIPGKGTGVNGTITVDSTDISTYIANAAGVDLPGNNCTVTIDNATERYHLTADGATYSWAGGLPAGTVLTVDIVDKTGDERVSVASQTVQVTVGKTDVAVPTWSRPSLQSTDPSKSGYYIIKQGESLQLTNTSGEYVVIAQGQRNTYEKATSITYDHGVGASDQSQIGQTVTANIEDTWNLNPQSDSMNFYVDNGAIEIPSSSIQYSNRDDKMTITLPEYGRITSVTIPNGTVTLDSSVGTQHTLSVSFSGMNLITTGSAISVTYEDEAQYTVTSGSSAARSSVNTPINFNIRPNVNSSNYLNMSGGYDSLLVSGSACSCEPIKVTIAGTTLNTYATQNTVWSDSTGNFDVTLPLGSIPDGDFTITAEYVDVNGTPMSISAQYDSYCATPAITSPIYEAMGQLTGLVEPNSTVILIVNGDESNVYTINVDRFGHFSVDFDSVNQALFAGDYFDIRIVDIAGNTIIRHYEIEEPGDPFEVSALVQPLGKFFYSADKEKESVAYMATPVSAADFTEDETTVELPLLFGATFEVGTMTLTKTEQGLTVTTEMDASVMDDSTVENEKLYVFTQEPTVQDIENHTNCTEYQYGDEIPMAEGTTLWILDEKDMTIDETDGAIEDLTVFEFDAAPGTLYAKFQEA